jgi:hypothetical protein
VAKQISFRTAFPVRRQIKKIWGPYWRNDRPMERFNTDVSSIIEHTLIHKCYRFPCYITRLDYRIFEFCLFARAFISILLNKKVATISYQLSSSSSGSSKTQNQNYNAIVSYSFVTSYACPRHLLWFDWILVAEKNITNFRPFLTSLLLQPTILR